MSSNSFEHMLREHPRWREPVEAILSFLHGLKSGTSAQPAVIAEVTGIPPAETIAFLQLLAENGHGRLRIRVVDDRGLEVKQFDSVGEIPPAVEDAFGNETEVTPENVELVFVSA